MKLQIDGQIVEFVALKDFRSAFNLPDSFELAHFQHKDTAGLGSIDRTGNALHSIRDPLLAIIPQNVVATDWLNHIPELCSRFEAELLRINGEVGLRESEIIFAVNGFGDMCNVFAFALVRAKLSKLPPPDFDTVYLQWLFDSVQVNSDPDLFDHMNQTWWVHLVTHAYGRVGLVIHMPHETHYVIDKALACPAEGYMVNLLRDVAAQIVESTI